MLFPQSEPVKLGNLNAAGYINNQIIFKSNVSKNIHVPNTTLRNIMPRTHFDFQENIKSVNQMFDYLYSKDSVQVDYELVTQYLEQDITFKNKSRKYDKYSGNRLHVYEHQDGVYLAVARKEIMNELCIYQMEELHNIVIPKVLDQKINFKTPIYQVESNQANRFIRTMEGVHVNRIDSNKYTTFRLDHEILHFAPNPYIKSKSCLVTVDNGIHIWDISSNNCVNWKKGGEKSWSTARYGPHPQILYRCDTTNIYASDLRDSASNEILLRESKDQITGLTKHPYEQFQFAFTTNKTTAVMDSRYAKHPILEWKITHGFEHQTHINYLKYPIDDTRNSLVYTWGRYYGDIISYSYDQTDSLPKSVNYQNYTSFKEHSLVKEKFTDEYRYNYIPVCRNIDAAIENSFEHPQWDPLYGVEFFQVNDKLTLLQLTATGELYVQGYKLGVEEDLDESTENRLTEIEESCRAKLRALNSKIKVPKFHAEKKEIPIGKLFTKWQSDLQSSLLELTPVTRKRKYSPKLKLEWPVPEIFTKYEHCEHDNFVKLNIKGDSGASSLPSAYYLFNPDYKEYSLKKLEKDMAEAVQISSNGKFQHDITLYGRPDSHSSSITNPIVGEKKLEGVSSWLLEQWQSDIPFEEIDDSQREQRTVRTKKRDAPLIHSSNRLSSSQPPVVAAKRSLSQSKSVAAINEVQSSRMASSQPVRSHMLVARSRESSSQPVKKPKRKKGF